MCTCACMHGVARMRVRVVCARRVCAFAQATTWNTIAFKKPPPAVCSSGGDSAVEYRESTFLAAVHGPKYVARWRDHSASDGDAERARARNEP